MLRRLLSVLGYLSLATVVVGGTFVLVAIGKGYNYDFKANRLVRQGLVILGTAPSGAGIKIDGKNLKNKTPYRTTLEAGDYNFEVFRSGYRSWAKRLSILPSGVTYAQYIILWPQEIKPQVQVPNGSIISLAASSNRRHVAYITEGSDASVWVLNDDGRRSTRVYQPKPPASGQPAESLSELTWSDDGANLLVRSAIGSKISYLLLSTGSNPTAVNLTDLFGFNLVNPRFNPNNRRELYWVSPEGLRRLNVDNKTVSAVLAEKVSSYAFGGDRVIYVTATSLGKSVWSMDRGGNKQELIQSIPESPSYTIDYGSYLGKDNLVIVPSQTNTVTLYRDIFSANPLAKVVSKDSQNAHFNDEGRFLVFHSPTQFGTYDLERDQFSATGQLASQPTYFDWFDNYHLLINYGGRLVMIEYDGANSVEIDPKAQPATAAYGSADGKRLFWLGQAPGSVSGGQLLGLDVKR